MKRDKFNYLVKWREQSFRKPLIIQGVRQVGKTWLVREFGKLFPTFVEFNFEKNPEYSEIFKKSLNPKEILADLGAVIGKKIIPGEALVFFDETQEAPEVLKSLRYFYEECPQLHLISAGSLLGFSRTKIPIGVGRVSFMNLYPLTFGEFIAGAGHTELRQKILNQPDGEPLLNIHHTKLLTLMRNYLLIGGMPAVAKVFFEESDFIICQNIQLDIIKALHRDFANYSKSTNIPFLRQIFNSVPIQLGKKFMYSRVNPEIRSVKLSSALDSLESAGIVYKIYHSKVEGIPLQSSINPNRFKVVFFDIGLVQRLLNVDLKYWMTDVDIMQANRGAIAEQFVGQELIAYLSIDKFSPLHYWQREKRNSSAEIDYLIESGQDIIPIEVKSGAQGGLKSINIFMKEKKVRYGIKVSQQSFDDRGKIKSVPLYAVEKLINTQK